jgi:hypothetical protein
MDKKILIGIIAVVVVAILGGLFLIGSSDVTLFAGDNTITLPSDYIIDDKGVAYNGDVGVMFLPVMGGNASAQKELFDTLKSKGSDAGYKNVTTDKVNGFKLYQFVANPDKLQKVSSDRVSSGNYETWKEYEPYIPYKDFTDMKVVKYRYVGYVKGDSIDELYIFTNNTDVDLYSSDINNIVNSIAVAEK